MVRSTVLKLTLPMIDIGRGTSMAHVMHWYRQRIPYVKTRLITKYFSERPWKNNNVGWYTVREKLFYIIDFTVHAAHGETPLNRHLLGEFSQKDTDLCIQITLCWTATVLEGLFGDYHSSSAALGFYRREVTNQLLVHDWLVTTEPLSVFIVASLKKQRKVARAGMKIYI